MYKLGRAWNDNQRYYRLAGTKDGVPFECNIHIPSSMQGRFRYVIDVIRADKSGAISKAVLASQAQEETQDASDNISFPEIVPEKVMTQKEIGSLKRYLCRRNAIGNCTGDFSLTRKWMDSCNIDEEKRTQIFAELHSCGVCCDCKILLTRFLE